MTFEGKHTIPTTIGAVTTCIVFTAYFLFILLMTVNFFSGNESYLNSTEHLDTNPIELDKLGYALAVEDLDPRYGRIVAQHVYWENRKPKVIRELSMSKCSGTA